MDPELREYLEGMKREILEAVSESFRQEALQREEDRRYKERLATTEVALSAIINRTKRVEERVAELFGRND